MNTNGNDGNLLSIGPMASRLGVQPKELRIEAEAGRVPCIRVGERGLLFDPNLVLAALRSRARSDSVEPESEVRRAAE